LPHRSRLLRYARLGAAKRAREGIEEMTRVDFAVVSLGLAVVLAGCPNPNTYTTPRTLDPGKVQWQVSPELIGVNYKTTNGSTDANGNLIKTNTSSVWPMLPSLGARIGVADGLEIGLRMPNLEPFAGDVKIRLMKGRVDVALDPGLQLYFASVNGAGFAALYLHAPVLVGINFSEKVSLVLSPGLALAENTAGTTFPTGVAGSSVATGFMARLGAGFDFRLGRRFSIHPEVTVARQFTGSTDLLLCVAGIGFNFGAQPDYSDLGTDKEPEVAPAPPEAPAPREDVPAPPEPSSAPIEL
jgi:hypothetical protein